MNRYRVSISHPLRVANWQPDWNALAKKSDGSKVISLQHLPENTKLLTLLAIFCCFKIPKQLENPGANNVGHDGTSNQYHQWTHPKKVASLAS